jgi:hypothetical protein
MNKAKLKSYAPQARKDFIAAVGARANLLGLAEKGGKLDIAPSEKKGDLVLISGQAWPTKVYDQRERLIRRIEKDGYVQTLETVAYTWFNRFAALRYMEIHDYLGHGYRVLSSREGGLPEILSHATEAPSMLPGLNAGQVAEMKLAGNKDGELYRLLLIAQCNALSNAMPFLFEHIDDESELLLPGNLERTDSVIAKLVGSIDEEDWNNVEVIGWLYQFYISEKKEELVGKVVKSEDIPAATQLFTPNWIVQYLAQNSIGRLWLMANPTSTLKSRWSYYIEPAEQSEETQAQLDALIQNRMVDDGGNLNPESITVLDPACGSGHILVEAYEVLKAIYLERGYQARAIPRLILEKNLFGLDIEDRAAQLAGFALMMKARADDRRLLDSPPKLNILSLQESKGLDLEEFASHLISYGVDRATLKALLDTFIHSKTFGSLIHVSEVLKNELAGLENSIVNAKDDGDVFASAVAKELLPLVQQAKILAMTFDAVLANPPYMGNKSINADLKGFLSSEFSDFDRDLFSAFISRNTEFTKPGGYTGFMSSFVWMYISTYEQVRFLVVEKSCLESLVQLDYDAYEDAKAHLCSFVYRRTSLPEFRGCYINLDGFKGAALQAPKTIEAINDRSVKWCFTEPSSKFRKIPGRPIAFWVPDAVADAFSTEPAFEVRCKSVKGLDTCDNARFVRRWYETSVMSIRFDVERVEDTGQSVKWFPYSKGGFYRKWYGNNEFIVDWENNGEILRTLRDKNGKIKSRPQSIDRYFQLGINFSAITSSDFSCRLMHRSIFGGGGNAVFSSEPLVTLGFLNSKIVGLMTKALNPTLNILVGDILRLPYKAHFKRREAIERNVSTLVELAKLDWSQNETAWEFSRLGTVAAASEEGSLQTCWKRWEEVCVSRLNLALAAEELNNEIFLSEYGLSDYLTAKVDPKKIPFVRADRKQDCQSLISYAIGCMLGRFSLDEPGLVYAHAGNIGFDATRYKTFSADADGIVPVSDELWFEDDAASRISDFLRSVWGDKPLEDNITWLADSLARKPSETPMEAIRRYLSTSFFKDHLQTYKKRPIYWLFSSGKQGAFQALVYMHRYHEGSLARMRAEYVVPLTGKIQSRIEMLEKDRDAAGTTTARNKIAKEIESLKKKHLELLAYDEKLRHYADMRIQLDLNDGVKVNYGKFGDLLAEVKLVTGGADDE